LKPSFWRDSQLTKTDYDTFIETGTYRGFAIQELQDDYSTIHSIEISKKWHAYCEDKFKGLPHIHLHLGDSVEKLPEILESIQKPVIIFLDAHYSGGSTEKASNDCDSSLPEELTFLKTREFDDIIIIDDIGFFNRVGGEEPKLEVSEKVVWPKFHYNWEQITMEKVLNLKKANYSFLENKASKYLMTKKEDILIFYPTGDTSS
jgi:hypothetical protein